jgi:hypothetical protein
MLNVFHQMGIVALFSVIVGVTPMFLGASYAFRPTEGRLALMRPISLASLFAAITGLVAGLINLLRGSSLRDTPLASNAQLMGLAESLVPLFIACGSLTIAWLFVALGLRRGQK